MEEREKEGGKREEEKTIKRGIGWKRERKKKRKNEKEGRQREEEKKMKRKRRRKEAQEGEEEEDERLKRLRSISLDTLLSHTLCLVKVKEEVNRLYECFLRFTIQQKGQTTNTLASHIQYLSRSKSRVRWVPMGVYLGS